MTHQQPIGIFDSGIGGLTVLKSLIELMPGENYIYLGDSKNAPYGEKPLEEIIFLTDKNVSILIEKSCKIIVVACNTATGAAIDFLRNKYTEISFVGLEPAIKPACLATKTGNIGVLATEGTFKGKHFLTTSEKYNNYVQIHSQAGYGLAKLAEDNNINSNEAFDLLKKYIEPLKDKNIDYLVLGCTHYPFFLNTIKDICGQAINVLDSGEAVARRTKDLLMTLGLLNISNSRGNVLVFSSGDLVIMNSLLKEYFALDPKYFQAEQIM